MRKNRRSLLLASLALTCGLLASCLSSGPEKPLGAMADAMEKNDSATFLAQMDMPLFAANEARNMTSENEALNMLDSLGQDLGLGGMDQLLGSALNMEDKLRKSLTRGSWPIAARPSAPTARGCRNRSGRPGSWSWVPMRPLLP